MSADAEGATRPSVVQARQPIERARGLSRPALEPPALAAARRRVRQRDRGVAVRRRDPDRDLRGDRRPAGARAVRRAPEPAVRRALDPRRVRRGPVRPAARPARHRPAPRRLHARDGLGRRDRRPDRGDRRARGPRGVRLGVLLPDDRRLHPEPRPRRARAGAGERRVGEPRQPRLRDRAGDRRVARRRRRRGLRAADQRGHVRRHRRDPVAAAALTERRRGPPTATQPDDAGPSSARRCRAIVAARSRAGRLPASC